MITISKNLIIPADQEENRKKLTAAINKKKTGDRTIFCVILPTTDGGILEVIPAFALRFEAKEHDITVVGACEGRKNAMALVEQMIGELYEKTGGFDAKAYYLQ